MRSSRETYSVDLSVVRGKNWEEDPKSKYPFAQMKVGDEEFFPGEKSQGRAASAARMCGYRTGKIFRTRSDKNGVTITRTF